MTRNPRHRLHPPGTAAPAPPLLSRNHPQSRKTETPGERCFRGSGLGGHEAGGRSEGGEGTGSSGSQEEEAGSASLNS